MIEEKNKPLVRFKKFEQKWEGKKLGVIYNFQYGTFNNNPSNGGLYPVYGANGIIGSYSNYNSEDSVVIGHMGEYAGSVLWAEGKHFVTYNGIITTPKDSSVTPKFGYYLLNRLDITKVRDGSGQPFLSYQALNNLDCAFPKSITEQSQIGLFFQNLDKLLTLHQRQHTKLTTLKKAMLKKMFPQEGSYVPEIRFKGFEDAWEEEQLGSIADRFDNLRIPITANQRVAGNTPYYGANGIQDYVEGHTHEGEFVLIAEDGANDLKNYPVQYVNGKIWVNNHAHVLQGKKNVLNNIFLKYAVSETNIEPFLVGGGRAKLNAETMMGIGIYIPSDIAEQEKIGIYFNMIDNLITQHRQQFDKLKNIKKACLDKMFV